MPFFVLKRTGAGLKNIVRTELQELIKTEKVKIRGKEVIRYRNTETGRFVSRGQRARTIGLWRRNNKVYRRMLATGEESFLTASQQLNEVEEAAEGLDWWDAEQLYSDFFSPR